MIDDKKQLKGRDTDHEILCSHSQWLTSQTEPYVIMKNWDKFILNSHRFWNIFILFRMTFLCFEAVMLLKYASYDTSVCLQVVPETPVQLDHQDLPERREVREMPVIVVLQEQQVQSDRRVTKDQLVVPDLLVPSVLREPRVSVTR